MSQRLLAIAFTFLMLVSALPASNATHTNPLIPDLPTLPQAKPTQSCIPTDVSPEVLARINQAVAGDPAWYTSDVGVPALCLNGEPVPQYVELITQLNAELNRLRNLTKEIQDQVDLRLEATLPEGALPEDLVEPKVVLLDETFDGTRKTGFGDWQVVTERGEDLLWRIQTSQDVNGTRHAYRFGDDDGYAQGAHQWLVSPEIDLTAVKANKTAISDLVAARDLARSRMEALCYNGIPPLVPALEVCRRDVDPAIDARFLSEFGLPFVAEVPHLRIILDTYEAAFDATIYEAPVMQHAAFLDLTYSFNMAQYTDGVRLWVYTGEKQPDRSVLFHPDFSRNAEGQTCVRDPAASASPKETRQAINGTGDRYGPNENDIGDYVCTANIRGGHVVWGDTSNGRPLPGMGVASTFQRNAPNTTMPFAFTGEQQTVTARLNLTDYAEQRIWILFEVKTERNDRGADTFHDLGNFRNFTDYGFELQRVFVQGDGYHRNLRLKEIGATYPWSSPTNAFGDASTVRTTPPPGNEAIVSYVHNAGDYTENATYVLDVRNQQNQLQGRFIQPVTLHPDEVRTLRIPWSAALNGKPLAEDALYSMSAQLVLPGMNVTLDGAVDGLPDELPPVADPNATQARIPNAAGTIPGAGAISITQMLRADTARNLTPLRADGTFGVPLQFCKSIEGTACTEAYAAPKGEQRIALIAVRNDGNTAQDIVADLLVELEGVSKSDIVAEGVRQTLRDVLPGETRPVTWTLTPTEPGAYRAAVAFLRSDGTPEPLVERRFYAQQSTGLICLDSIDVRECGPAFTGGLVPELENENVTAATVGPDGTLYVVTEVFDRHPDTGAEHGRLAAMSPAGEWRILANLTGTTLNDTFSGAPWADWGWGDFRSIVLAPDGAIWLAGDNASIVARLPNGELKAYRGTEETFTEVEYDSDGNELRYQVVPHLRAAAWHNGTLLAAGTNGRVLRIDGENVTVVKLNSTQPKPDDPNARTSLRVWDDINALVQLPTGALLLLGDDGLLLRNVPGENTWSEPTVNGDVARFSLGRALRGGAIHDGRVYLYGDDTLLVSEANGFGAYRSATQPVPLPLSDAAALPAPMAASYASAASSALGSLWLVDHDGRVASCGACEVVTPDWEHVTLPLPPVYEKGPLHPARPALVVAGEDATFLVGEGGLVLRLDDVGVYDNAAGWTVVPDLAPRDGGVIETGGTAPGPTTARQSLLVLPLAPGQAIANEATKFRLFVNHSIAQMGIENSTPVEVHLVYVNYPSHEVAAGGGTHLCGPMTRQGGPLEVACNAQRVRHLVASYERRTDSSGWESRAWDDLPSAELAAAAGSPDRGVAAFYAVEFYASSGVRWAIDDVRLQGFVGGKWQDVLSWHGPSVSSGTAWTADPAHTVGGALTSLGQPNDGALARNPVVTQSPQWNITPSAPFKLDVRSPWHITTQYADRPVFAANNEQYILTDACCAAPTAPRLLNGWNSRLVSPVIDLRDTHDPAIEFDHTYAFRLQTLSPTSRTAGDGGLLEIQYLRQGPDCGADSFAVSCGWSPFYVVHPDADYPYTPKGLTVGTTATEEVSGRIAPRNSYWGRLATPDETGYISSPRRTDEYVTERITLANVTCGPTLSKRVGSGEVLDCVPVNLTGRQIRVAFHLVTVAAGGASANAFNLSTADSGMLKFRASFPGEGWYIGDFKVLGSRQLGVDLRASNLTLRVGYDVADIGVGPGTRVPVNVTVKNDGTFDALGYTGQLKVERVLNRALKETVVVDTVLLAQQPVLGSAESANHTLYWTVPSAPEGAEYILSFEATPIGVARDEDFTDNVVTLGTLSTPIVAKTMRRFDTEFLVSPPNATIDITRYMPMYINNTGNVPLEGFRVERRIAIIGRLVDVEARTCDEWRRFVADGRPTAIVDCRAWETNAPAPAGARTPLTAISNEINPSADLFWKAPERANYIVTVSADTLDGGALLQSASDTRVSAFATFLFDDVEGGPRGESDSGAWVPASSWAPSQPGFRSTDAYAFGEPLLGRYPANANDSMVSPTIDLGNARAASVGWFQKYAFEPGFDGGVIEGSKDGGATWSVIPVAPDSATRAGYNQSVGYAVQPSSPLHPDGSPVHEPVYAFTGDSSLHPANVDGWVFSELDLTDFGAITEPGVAYDAYGSIEMKLYAKRPTEALTPRLARDASWCGGSSDTTRCWLVENVSAQRVSPLSDEDPETQDTFWWSGSPSYDDDQKRPIENNMLSFPLDLTTIQSDQVVTAEWWEYASRFYETGEFQEKGRTGVFFPPELYTAYMFHNGDTGAETTRYNLGQPEILETRGKWYHMRADITGIVSRAQAEGRTTIDVGFSYTPVDRYAAEVRKHFNGEAITDEERAAVDTLPAQAELDSSTGTNYGGSNMYADRPGFAIDGFLVSAQRVVRGQPLGAPVELLTEETAWNTKRVTECGNGLNPSVDAIAETNPWRKGTTRGIACLDGDNGRFISRDPIYAAETEGRNWAAVTAMPGAPSGWGTVDVLDHDGERILPTKDLARAWYSGELPYETQTAAPAAYPIGNHRQCRRGPDTSETPGSVGPEDLVQCPLPGSESRLVTPAFDLGRVAGTNAQLSFWQRYAFANRHLMGDSLGLASGGVVEYQEFDTQTGEWSAWRQLYSGPIELKDGQWTSLGGYTAVTANVSRGQLGVHRFDPPFENNRVAGFQDPVQVLFSGKSTDLPGNKDGWVQTTFDVSDLIGKRVRFGFHAAWSDQLLAEQALTRLTNPDETTPGIDRSGWWIADVSLVGNVIVGEPIQLRWRAGSDANVQDGTWLLDDLAVYGSRYRNNVGLFVDTTPGAFGAYNGTSAAIPITVRNLGDSVRTGLAIEVINTDTGVELDLSAPGEDVRYVDDKLYIEGLTLGPGQGKTILLAVGTPRVGGSTTKLLFTLKEAADASSEDPYIAIVNNEVQGLLTRTVGFEVQRDPRTAFTGEAKVRQSSPPVGAPVDFDLVFNNSGYGPARLALTCKAQTIMGWDKENHIISDNEEPQISAEYPCELVGGDLTLPGRSDMTLTYRVTPTVAGYLRLAVNGTVLGGAAIERITTGTAVGMSPLAYEMHFDGLREVIQNYTVTNSALPPWDHLRGNYAPGSLLIGINENATKGAFGGSYDQQCYPTLCRVSTPPIDLHNYSRENPAFLTFWHMDRLAKHDGARVTASILENEQRPASPSSWSKPCVLAPPRGGWEGNISRVITPPPTTQGGGEPGDENAAWFIAPPQFNVNDVETDREFFITENGIWEEDWTLAVFDLSQPARVAELKDDVRLPCESLLGRTVRFDFEVLAGQFPDGKLARGPGQGMYVDDITVGPLSVEVAPEAHQRATLVDNTTKEFHVLVRNLARSPDSVTLVYDAQNSSAPAGSVSVDSAPVLLGAGESRIMKAFVTLPRDPSLLPTDFKMRFVARSLLDPNAAGETFVDVAFGPRQWAELSLAAEAPRGLVQEGTETFIPLTLENNGLVESVNTTIRVTDTWAGGSSTIEIPLAGIAAYAVAPEESTRVVEFRWRPEKGSIGTHTLRFEVDPDVLGEEYTRDNNVVTLTADVVELLIPDLAVDSFEALTLRNAVGGMVSPALDADVARYEVAAGELVSLELKVANDGRAGATNVDVRAFIGDLSLPPKTIPYIAPGTEAIVTFNWLAQKGEHEIEFLVRSEQVELSNANNRYPGVGVTLLTVKGYEVEVAIPALDLLLEPGSSVDVPFSVRNAGNAGEELVLTASAPAGMRLTLPREGFYLRAGETYSDNARLVLDAEAVAGEQFISIDAVARENPMKVATGRAPVRVNASYGGSVVGALASGAPPELTIPIELVNEGNSLEPWSVFVRLPAGWTSVEPMPLALSVPAHGRLVHELQVRVPVDTAPGERSMQTKATMANGETREAISRVNVLPLRAAAVQVSDALPRPERGTLTVPVVIENRGNVQQPFEVLLVDPPAGIEVKITPSTFELPPGGKAVAALVVKPNESVEVGTYAITSYARFDGVTPQTSEGRANLQSIKVPVVRQDLRLSPLEYSPRAELDAGDRVSVKVSVTNRGLTELTDVPVHLFVDDVFIEEVILASIASGARADVTFNWTAITGVHTLTAVVDPYADTVDGDRADNAVSALATVGDETVAGGVAAGRADTPAPGILGIVAALVAAILLTRSIGSRRQRR